MKPLVILAAALGIAAPAFAGSSDSAPADAPVVAPAPAVTYGGEWTGGYAGLSIGGIDIDATGAPDGEHSSYGLHLGYDYDFGQFVLGGEIEYETTNIGLGAVADVDSVARLKLRGGYDLGRTLLYATAGMAEIDTSIGSETGSFAGVGVSYQLNDRFYLGGEVLGHRFDDINGSGVDADATSLSIRGGLRF
ncbi:porin family protein [Aliishimia ponticola]|uniref:Porin family protein n=1 Tax=Aliishimia ponticola TaxID=2499833 RepID=A0A4S4NKV0_9RHOB|nr:outer membrane beta-barrel protein [Aliishimia ponticola]THH38901.1 porin family protein [Aliishimia ponticola]